jgi:hypothetical protein
MSEHLPTAAVAKIHDIAEDVAYIKAELKGHVGNESIHTMPPCDAHKTLAGRLWLLGVSTLAALIGVAYNALKGQ